MSAGLDEDAALRRITRILLALAAAGALVWLAAKGARGAVSFAAGAAVSGFGFWWLQRLARGMEEAVKSGRAKGASALFHSLRILLLGGVLYAILRVYEVFIPALVTGLLVTVAAITLEVLYEWIYGTTS